MTKYILALLFAGAYAGLATNESVATPSTVRASSVRSTNIATTPAAVKTTTQPAIIPLKQTAQTKTTSTDTKETSSAETTTLSADRAGSIKRTKLSAPSATSYTTASPSTSPLPSVLMGQIELLQDQIYQLQQELAYKADIEEVSELGQQIHQVAADANDKIETAKADIAATKQDLATAKTTVSSLQAADASFLKKADIIDNKLDEQVENAIKNLVVSDARLAKTSALTTLDDKITTANSGIAEAKAAAQANAAEIVKAKQDFANAKINFDDISNAGFITKNDIVNNKLDTATETAIKNLVVSDARLAKASALEVLDDKIATANTGIAEAKAAAQANAANLTTAKAELAADLDAKTSNLVTTERLSAVLSSDLPIEEQIDSYMEATLPSKFKKFATASSNNDIKSALGTVIANDSTIAKKTDLSGLATKGELLTDAQISTKFDTLIETELTKGASGRFAGLATKGDLSGLATTGAVKDAIDEVKETAVAEAKEDTEKTLIDNGFICVVPPANPDLWDYDPTTGFFKRKASDEIAKLVIKEELEKGADGKFKDLATKGELTTLDSSVVKTADLSKDSFKNTIDTIVKGKGFITGTAVDTKLTALDNRFVKDTELSGKINEELPKIFSDDDKFSSLVSDTMVEKLADEGFVKSTDLQDFARKGDLLTDAQLGNKFGALIDTELGKGASGKFKDLATKDELLTDTQLGNKFGALIDTELGKGASGKFKDLATKTELSGLATKDELLTDAQLGTKFGNLLDTELGKGASGKFKDLATKDELLTDAQLGTKFGNLIDTELGKTNGKFKDFVTGSVVDDKLTDWNGKFILPKFDDVSGRLSGLDTTVSGLGGRITTAEGKLTDDSLGKRFDDFVIDKQIIKKGDKIDINEVNGLSGRILPETGILPFEKVAITGDNVRGTLGINATEWANIKGAKDAADAAQATANAAKGTADSANSRFAGLVDDNGKIKSDKFDITGDNVRGALGINATEWANIRGAKEAADAAQATANAANSTANTAKTTADSANSKYAALVDEDGLIKPEKFVVREEAIQGALNLDTDGLNALKGIKTLRAQVDTLDENVNTVAGSVSTISTNVSTIGTRLNTIGSAVNELNQTIDNSGTSSGSSGSSDDRLIEEVVLIDDGTSGHNFPKQTVAEDQLLPYEP